MQQRTDVLSQLTDCANVVGTGSENLRGLLLPNDLQWAERVTYQGWTGRDTHDHQRHYRLQLRCCLFKVYGRLGHYQHD